MLKIDHLNTRALLSSLMEFSNLVLEKNVDIFAVTEIWLSSQIRLNSTQIEGFLFHRVDRLCREEGVWNLCKK